MYMINMISVAQMTEEKVYFVLACVLLGNMEHDTRLFGVSPIASKHRTNVKASNL